MKHSILLVVPKPDKKNGWECQLWESLPATFASLSSKHTNLEVIGENVLLIGIDDSLTPLVESLSEIGKLPYRYIISDEEIKVHEAVSKP